MNYQPKIDNTSEENTIINEIPEMDELDEDSKKIAFSKSSQFKLELSTINTNAKKSRKTQSKIKKDEIDIELYEKRDIKKFNPRHLPSDWNGEISVKEYNKKHNKTIVDINPKVGGFPSLGGIKINKPLVKKLWGKILVSN